MQTNSLIIPYIEPETATYQNLAESLGLSGLGCVTISPPGEHAFLSCGRGPAYLMDLFSLEIISAIDNTYFRMDQIHWSADGAKLAYVHDNHLSVITVDAGPQTVYAEALDFTIDLPPRWVFYEVDGMPMFTSDERFGDWPTPMHYFVYVQEYPNPEERPFAKLIIQPTADLSDEIQANFSYTTDTIGPYTVYRTEWMPSRSGALTIFFELPGRYLALALTPYDSEQPYQDQDRYLALFEAMLESVR